MPQTLLIIALNLFSCFVWYRIGKRRGFVQGYGLGRRAGAILTAARCRMQQLNAPPGRN